MLRNDPIINSIVHGDMVKKIVRNCSVDLTEARELISAMTFKEYRALEEASADIVPPSGQPITPAVKTPTTTLPTATPGVAPTTAPADPRGVQVKNPATGQMEWQKPGTTPPGTTPPVTTPPGTTPPADANAQQVAEDKALARMKHLAGIKEDASAGSTASGAIATIPMPSGKMKHREVTSEQKPVEYTRTEVPKTIVGDTKPGQATGELSANLVARGQKSASRNKNGQRR